MASPAASPQPPDNSTLAVALAISVIAICLTTMVVLGHGDTAFGIVVALGILFAIFVL